MKSTEQYFHVLLFIMLYKVVFTSMSFKTLACDQMKATEQYFLLLVNHFYIN